MGYRIIQIHTREPLPPSTARTMDSTVSPNLETSPKHRDGRARSVEGPRKQRRHLLPARNKRKSVEKVRETKHRPSQTSNGSARQCLRGRRRVPTNHKQWHPPSSNASPSGNIVHGVPQCMGRSMDVGGTNNAHRPDMAQGSSYQQHTGVRH